MCPLVPLSAPSSGPESVKAMMNGPTASVAMTSFTDRIASQQLRAKRQFRENTYT